MALAMTKHSSVGGGWSKGGGGRKGVRRGRLKTHCRHHHRPLFFFLFHHQEQFSPDAVDFLARVAKASGLGDATALTPSIKKMLFKDNTYHR